MFINFDCSSTRDWLPSQLVFPSRWPRIAPLDTCYIFFFEFRAHGEVSAHALQPTHFILRDGADLILFSIVEKYNQLRHYYFQDALCIDNRGYKCGIDEIVISNDAASFCHLYSRQHISQMLPMTHFVHGVATLFRKLSIQGKISCDKYWKVL